MNQLTSKQRKIVYLVTLFVLGGLIIFMARPGDGRLPQMRVTYELGEATLGDVDPASSTLNLVLLGMRGVAANLLWMEADHLKDTKNWSELQQRVNSIILLQPHFKKVWEYQSWNLAYNVSAECDRVADRFFWVKEGIKFIQEGTERNRHVPELFHDTGYYIGNKIGTSDEKVQFRRFFLIDPMDELFDGGPDPAINPQGRDNYLVARDWYLEANRLVAEDYEQHKMAEELFLAYPQRSVISYAGALQSMGDPFTGDPDWDEARRAWAQAYEEWTTVFGQELLRIPVPPVLYHIRLEPSDDAAYALMLSEQLPSEEEFVELLTSINLDPITKIRDTQNLARKTTSYLYWRLRCNIEQNEQMAAARQNYFEGKRLFIEPPQDFAAAQVKLEAAMAAFQEVLTEFPELIESSDADVLEDALKSVIIWQDIIVNKRGETLPDDYPLKELWEDERYAAAREEFTSQFLGWQGSGL